MTQACQEKVRLNNAENKEKQNNDSIVQNVGTVSVSVREVCVLFEHLLSSLPLDTQQQTQSARMPNILSGVTNLLTDHLSVLTSDELSSCLALCHNILKRLIPSVALPAGNITQSRPGSRASVNTFSSLQLNCFSQVSRPSLVMELSARESLSTENGIVQIGIEANEKIDSKDDVSLNLDSKDTWSGSGSNNDDTTEQSHSPFPEDSNLINGHVVPLSPDGEITEENNSSADEDEIDTISSHDSISSNKDDHLEPNSDVYDKSKLNHTSLSSNEKIDEIKSERIPDSFEYDLTCPVTEQVHERSDEEFESAPQSPKVVGSPPLYSYVKEFERLFLHYIQKRIVSSSSQLQDFQKILFENSVANKNNLVELIGLLHECLQCHENKVSSAENSSENSFSNASFTIEQLEDSFSVIKLKDFLIEELPVFKAACNILVDLSSIPTTSCIPIQSSSPHQLPSWLIGLLVCVVCGKQCSPQFTQAAVSTLLELITLAMSELSIWVGGTSAPAPNPSGGDGVVNIKIIPLLVPAQTHSLLHHTPVHQVNSKFLFLFFTEFINMNLDS